MNMPRLTVAFSRYVLRDMTFEPFNVKALPSRAKQVLRLYSTFLVQIWQFD